MTSDDELHALLADPSVWEQPSDTLEDAVVAAIAREAAPIPTPSRRRRPRLVAAVGAAAAIVAIVLAAVVAGSRPTDHPQFAAALQPTGLVPSVEGHADFTRKASGWRIYLDAHGLPRLDHGRFYQAWLRSDDGDLVAIGTFNEARNVVLWSGVSPADHPTITITEEAADNDPASSGRRVLVGTATER